MPRSSAELWARLIEQMRRENPAVPFPTDDDYRRLRRGRREYAYITCWKMSERESAALWAQYTRDGAGVAIRSNIPRLKQALRDCGHDFYIGAVHYIDYETTRSTPAAPSTGSLRAEEFRT